MLAWPNDQAFITFKVVRTYNFQFFYTGVHIFTFTPPPFLTFIFKGRGEGILVPTPLPFPLDILPIKLFLILQRGGGIGTHFHDLSPSPRSTTAHNVKRMKIYENLSKRLKLHKLQFSRSDVLHFTYKTVNVRKYYY